MLLSCCALLIAGLWSTAQAQAPKGRASGGTTPTKVVPVKPTTTVSQAATKKVTPPVGVVQKVDKTPVKVEKVVPGKVTDVVKPSVKVKPVADVVKPSVKVKPVDVAKVKLPKDAHVVEKIGAGLTLKPGQVVVSKTPYTHGDYHVKHGHKHSDGYYYYKGKNHHHWHHCVWNPYLCCHYYYCPSACCYYYWCGTTYCYYPCWYYQPCYMPSWVCYGGFGGCWYGFSW
jgi:hypothetical protein